MGIKIMNKFEYLMIKLESNGKQISKKGIIRLYYASANSEMNNV